MQYGKSILITFSFFLCFAFIPQSLYGMLSDEILRVMSKKETEGYTDEEKEKQKRYLEYERSKAPGLRMQQYLKTRFEKKPESKSLKDFRLHVIQSFKNNIIKKIKDDSSKKTAVHINMISAVASSPNGKWIATGSGRYHNLTTFFHMWQINKDNTIQKEAINQPSSQDITKPIQSLAFSPDSKNIAIGTQASSSEVSDLLLYKIDDNGVLSKEPQKLDEYSSSIDIVTFDPTGKKMLSIPRNTEGIVVWNIDENGNASEYISLLPKKRFDTAVFNSDGSMLVAGENNKLFIWYFNENKIINETPIVHIINSLSKIYTIAFIPHSKKCIIAGRSNHNTKKGLIICDLSDDKNIKYEKIESYQGGDTCNSVYVSSDGHMIIAANDTGLYLLTINNDNSISLIGEIPLSTNKVVFNEDPNKIISFGYGYLYLYTLLTKKEKKILDSLNNLNRLQLSLIDKTLQGVKNIPLANYKIPHNILILLEKLGLISPSLAKPVMSPYFFDQLIEEFEYFAALSSPSEDVLKAKKNLSQKIAVMSPQMDLESLMKNKEILLKLDPTVPETESLFEKLNASYMKVMGKSEITGKSKEIIYIPEDIIEMSATLKNIKDDLAGGDIPEINIPIEGYSSSTIGKVRDIIHKKISLEDFSLNELDELIDITNCANYLAFHEILPTFTNKIYSLCKPLSLREIPEQLKSLYGEALKPYVIQVFKNEIIKKPIKGLKKVTFLYLQNDRHANTTISSPNGKMIAVGYGAGEDSAKGGFCVYKIGQDGTINENQSPQIIGQQSSVTHLAFSPNSKSIVVGSNASEEDNLFLFKIENERVIEKDSQVLVGHSKPIIGVAFHPSGQAIVSVSEDNTILLRALDSNNQIEKPLFLDRLGIEEIKNICFNHDGTLLVCSGMKSGPGEGKAHYILVWKFDTNGKPKDLVPIVHKISEMLRINDISWLPKTNKCCIGGNRHYSNKAGLIWCDISEEILAIHKIENYENNCSFVEISPDGTMIIVGNNDKNNHVELFSLSNYDSIKLNFLKTLNDSPRDFSFTANSNQIIMTSNLNDTGNIKIDTLIPQQDKEMLQLKDLNSYQLLLIDKVLSEDNSDDAFDYLKKNNIPQAIIKRLGMLSSGIVEDQAQPPQEIAKPSFTKEDASFISKLWNLAKAYWPGSKQ